MNRLFIFLLILGGIFALFSISEAGWVPCWRTNSCQPTMDSLICDGGDWANYWCDNGGRCVFESEVWCSGNYCGDRERAECNPPPEPSYECDDGEDNDGDGLYDWDGAGVSSPDPGCSGPGDNNEYNPPTCCGSISVSVNQSNPTWQIRKNNGALGCSGSGNGGCGGMEYTWWNLSLGNPSGYDCSPDAWSKQIWEGNPDKTFDVTCTATTPPPTVDLDCNSLDACNIPKAIPPGSNITLSWTTSNATSCTASSTAGDWSGAKATSGSESRGPLNTTRTYTLNCSGPGGSGQDSVVVTVLSSDSQFISQSIPKTTLAPGENMNVSVTMRNCRPNNDCSGLSTWTKNGDYGWKLGSQNPQDNPTFGGRVYLPDGVNISPGSQHIFSWGITAPMSPGAYNFQWRMVHEGVEWFGEFTPNVVLNVVNQLPTASTVKVTEPDYCLVGPSQVAVSWIYSDPDATSQSSFQLQVDDNAGFANPNYDTGKLAMNCSNNSTCVWNVPAGANLSWGTIYWARVKVWDGSDGASGWVNQSRCIGPIDTNSGEANPAQCTIDPNDNETSWKSPQNQYPTGVNGWTHNPFKPQAGQVITFDGTSTVCYKTPPNTVDACNGWSWDWGDGTAFGTQQNTTHTYADPGNFSVRLKATDTMNGYHCTGNRNLTIQKPIPSWKEVFPR